jgi:hypothetical protein
VTTEAEYGRDDIENVVVVFDDDNFEFHGTRRSEYVCKNIANYRQR